MSKFIVTSFIQCYLTGNYLNTSAHPVDWEWVNCVFEAYIQVLQRLRSMRNLPWDARQLLTGKTTAEFEDLVQESQKSHYDLIKRIPESSVTKSATP
ncbi:MAG: hypothetical protein WB643_04315 [Candidatus Bathyarchaeia archaeon]